jgi:hypothetical protein
MVEEYKKSLPKRRKVAYKGVATRTGGTYKGIFKRARKKLHGNLTRKLGVELTSETRGTVSDNNVVAVGHGPAVGTILYAVVAAIWRKLYEAAGYDLSDWLQVPSITPDLYQVIFGWRDTYNTAPVNTQTVSFVITDTHQDIVTKIRNSFMDTSVVGNDTFNLDYIRIVPVAGTAVDKLVMSHLSCRNMKVEVNQTSVCVIQNRTPGAAATDDQITDVTNNPLTGRSFDFKYNYFAARGEVSGNQGDSLDPRYGSCTLTTASNEAGIKSKVPGPSDLRTVTGSTRILLNPGMLKKSKITMKFSLCVNTYMNKLRTYLKSGTSGTVDTAEMPCFLGHGRVLMFEKMCDTGAGTQPCTIGYELSVITSAMVKRVPHAFTRRIDS